MIRFDEEKCIGCGCCEEACMFGALHMAEGRPVIEPECRACNSCVKVCPVQALKEETEPEAADREDYAGFWVVGLEEEEKHLKKATLELLSAARTLADQKNSKVTLLVFGVSAAPAWKMEAESVGCDRILALSGKTDRRDIDFRTGAVVQAVQAKKPETVLIPATADGRDLAPKIACRLGTGLTADCTGLDIDENGNLIQIRPTYGGSIMASIITPAHRPQMASIRPNVMEVIRRKPKKRLEEEVFQVCEEPGFGRTLLKQKEEIINVFGNLEEAEVVVAGGFGLGSKENFEKMCALCTKLHATAGATRKAVDEGWAPPEIQIGQTGKTVAPQLYIAFGVSGALQHTLGMNRAKKIIAVNNDPAAPVFGISDVAILGDAGEILSALLERLV